MSSSLFEWAIIHSNELTYANFALILYDHLVTFGQEVTHFWSDSWNASQILYLAVRYLALTFALLGLYAHVGHPSENVAGRCEFSGSAIWFSECLEHPKRQRPTLGKLHSVAFDVLFNAAVITFRVWHLFSRNAFIKTFAVAMFLICTIATAVFAGISYDTMKHELTSPDPASSPVSLVAVYVPSLVIHTVLFGLKLYRFTMSSKTSRSEALLRRFVKEGMVMYAFATGSLLFTIVGLSLTSSAELPYFYTALQSGLPVGATAVSVCHAILGIRSLASTFHVDPEWLLNHAEMSRVPWRTGAIKSEIYVELGYP
ncbi:hypothetical protein HYDPIDRAFT_26250 [Hydnomerulius pinastri MD-312]|nr:hypothetical protein HYDPIDRAFT_26250 [Hydnomerulius pinastri MD-312]